MEKAQTFRGASVTLGAIVGFCFGEANGLLIALVFCMAVDYITGWIKAIYLRNLITAEYKIMPERHIQKNNDPCTCQSVPYD